MLTIEQYRGAETAALQGLPNRVAQIYVPIVFQQAGYPTRLASPADLTKFADVMQELRFVYTVDYMLAQVSDEELALLAKVVEITIAGLTGAGAQPIIPWNALLRALLNYRHIRFVAPKGGRILELGPGSGYLGLMLVLGGFKYASTDVTEGFYLYQHHLMRTGLGQRFVDLAETGASHLTEDLFDEYDAAHVPWWAYHCQQPREQSVTFDLVTCNHMLAEMAPLSLHYLFEYMAKSAEMKPGYPIFAFEHFGYDLVNVPNWYVNSRFYEYGYALCHHDTLATVYAPRASPAGENGAAYPLVDLANRPDVAKIHEMGKQDMASMWTPRKYHCPTNPLSRQVLDRREILRSTLKHDRAAIVAHLNALLPGAAQPGEAPDELVLRAFGLGAH